MKIIILLVLGLSTLQIHGQVGIKTENPKGALHIDGNGQNPTSSSISAEQAKDDLSVHASKGSMNVGIGAIPEDNSSAQLELGGIASAFLPNRVALKSVTDKQTVPNPVPGMIVYNTTDNNGLTPDLYTYSAGGKWVEIRTKEVASVIERRDLWVGPGGSGQTEPVTHQQAVRTPLMSTLLRWADPATLTTDQPFIRLPEDGSFIFSFRFYMRPSAKADKDLYRSVLYLWAFKGQGGDFLEPDDSNAKYVNPEYLPLPPDATVEDVAEINMIAYATPDGEYLTAALNLTATGKKDDKISFRIGATAQPGIYTGYPIAAPLQATPTPLRTSMIFWKL